MPANDPLTVITAPFEERLHRLDARFATAIDALHDSLETLLRCPSFTYRTRPSGLPEQVVYLFSEGATPLYVGRSNHFRQRLANHYGVSDTGAKRNERSRQ